MQDRAVAFLGGSGGFEHLQAAHRAGTGGEMIRLDAHALQDVDEEVRQWVVALAVKDEVLAMLEAAAREEDWQVGGDMGVRVAEIAAVEHHRAVEQGLVALFVRLQGVEETGEQLHVLGIDPFEIGQLCGAATVVREVVVAV